MNIRIDSIKANNYGFTGTINSYKMPQAIADAMYAINVSELEVQGEYDAKREDASFDHEFGVSKGTAIYVKIVSACAYDELGNLLFDLVDFGSFDSITLEKLEEKVLELQ